jgi:hypothetical protein
MLGQYSPGYHEPEDHEFFGRDRSGSMTVSVYFDDSDPLGDKWSEIHWTCADGEVSFKGVSSWTSKTYVTNEDRENCACMLIEAEQKLEVSAWI